MINKMCGSCPPVGGLLEVVYETRNEEQKQVGPENTVCSLHRSVSPHILVPSIHCIIRRDDTNQILFSP